MGARRWRIASVGMVAAVAGMLMFAPGTAGATVPGPEQGREAAAGQTAGPGGEPETLPVRPGASEKVTGKSITRSPSTSSGVKTTCTEFPVNHELHPSLLCVSTGPGSPTNVWFDNRTTFPLDIRLGVDGSKFAPLWGDIVWSNPGTIEGGQWSGLANDCFYGLLYPVGGSVSYKTHAPACV